MLRSVRRARPCARTSSREGERAVNLHNQFKTMSLAPRTDRSFFSPRPPVWKKSHSWRYINYGRLSIRARRALVRLSGRTLVAVASGALKTSLLDSDL